MPKAKKDKKKVWLRNKEDKKFKDGLTAESNGDVTVDLEDFSDEELRDFKNAIKDEKKCRKDRKKAGDKYIKDQIKRQRRS